ncbi:MAG: haloacid dehalogenase-like hydrolase [Lachnospiraceae bacterium]|nr:haloacid dehalogenase-like hydrolase [Lachnospiraceae bacterium]
MNIKGKLHRAYLLATICILSCLLCSCGSKNANVLPSWNDNSSNKQAIIDFVESVTDKKSDNYVPIEERIATFDMDGTIVVEKKLWLELAVAVYRIDNELSDDKELVALKDELLENIKMDPEPPNTGQLIADVTGRAFQGMSQEDFVLYMNRFMQEEKPDFPGLTYKDCFYKPMLELINYLQENDFTVYIVSGSERGVIWGAAADVVGLPRSQMIGGDITLIAGTAGNSDDISGHDVFEPNDSLIRELGFTQRSIKMDKVYNIYHQIGICPILACGNTDGDFSMLNYVKNNPNHTGLALLINHDDNEREYQYNVTERAEWDALAEKYGWNVISMKNEFNSIFLKEAQKTAE